MTGTAAAGPASTESARLIALANVLASQAGDWQLPGTTPACLLDRWRPGRAITPSLLIGARIGTARLQLLLDPAAHEQWFPDIPWQTMSQEVRTRYVTHRGHALLAWLEQTLGRSLTIHAVTAVPRAPAPESSGSGRSPTPDPSVSAADGADAHCTALSFRVRRAPAHRQEAWLSLILEPAALASAEQLAHVIGPANAGDDTTGTPTAARPAPRRAGAVPRQEAAFDFELLAGRLRLLPGELACVHPGALLPVPDEGRAGDERAGGAASATVADRRLPLSLALGRTPLMQAALGGGLLHFHPIPSHRSAAFDGEPPTMTADPKQLELDVSLRFGKLRMTLAQLAAIRPGQTLQADVRQNEPEVDIVVDGRVVGTGTLIQVGSNWAVSVRRWGDDGN